MSHYTYTDVDVPPAPPFDPVPSSYRPHPAPRVIDGEGDSLFADDGFECGGICYDNSIKALCEIGGAR